MKLQGYAFKQKLLAIYKKYLNYGSLFYNYTKLYGLCAFFWYELYFFRVIWQKNGSTIKYDSLSTKRIDLPFRTVDKSQMFIISWFIIDYSFIFDVLIQD